MMLAIQTEEDEEEAQAQVLEKEKRNSFALSQSGTFKLSDFAVNKGGMHDTPDPKTPAGAAAPSQPAAGRLDVKSLDELVMMEELGAGASGSVRKAKHMPTGEIVAVKQITILEKAKRDQMVTELRITRQHACPWIVSVHNAFYDEGCVYVVLEFMDYGSLQDLVDKHAGAGLTDETELAKLAIQMLNGLNYLHRQHHQVHRDLKPANVLLNRVGQVKISDFGISSQLEATGEGICSTSVGTFAERSRNAPPRRRASSARRLSAPPATCRPSVCAQRPTRTAPTSGPSASSSSSSPAAPTRTPPPEARFAEICRDSPRPAPCSPPPYSTDGGAFYQLLGQIADEPAPTLPAGHFSASLRDLLRRCLDKEPTRRPTAQELLSDAWLASGSHSHA